MDVAHAFDQLTHVVGARTTCRLVSHRRYPFNPIAFEQLANRHQHQRYRTVTTDKVFLTIFDSVVNDIAVDWV